MEFYPWLVFLHLVGVVLFSISHGVSIAMAFAIREARDPDVVASQLANSQRAVRITYVALLLLAIGGLGAAWVGGLLLARWAVASYVVLGVALVVMWAVASPYYLALRKAVASDPTSGRRTLEPGNLEALLASRRPDALSAVGGLALLLLIGLMVLKPG
jgi:Predicted integral membrane protein (DUF2269)